MTLPSTRNSYTAEYSLLDLALASENGIRQSCDSEGSARHLCTRLNYARKLDREENQTIFPQDSPEWGISPYDSLTVKMPKFADDKWWVYIRPRKIVGEVQELGAAE